MEPRLGAGWRRISRVDGEPDKVTCSPLTGTHSKAFASVWLVHSHQQIFSSLGSLKREKAAFYVCGAFMKQLRLQARLGQTKELPRRYINTQSRPLGLMHRNCCLDTSDISLRCMIQSEAHCAMFLYIHFILYFKAFSWTFNKWWFCVSVSAAALVRPVKIHSQLLLTRSLVITWGTQRTKLLSHQVQPAL